MIILLYIHLIGFLISFSMLCYTTYTIRYIDKIENLKLFIQSTILILIFGWFSVVPIYKELKEIKKLDKDIKENRRKFAKENGFKRYGKR